MKNKLVITILLLCISLCAQGVNYVTSLDSVKKMGFTELKKKFDNCSANDKNRLLYGNTYYKKSKYQNDRMIIMEGLFMAATISKNKQIGISYLDSIISLSADRSDFIYPAKAYILKSEYLLYDNHWNEGLINLLKAEKYSEKKRNIKQNSFINEQIGLIKTNLGKYEEALPLIKQHYLFLKSNNDCSPAEISYSTFLLSDLYNRLKKPDSALYYNNKRLKEIKPQNVYYKYLILSNGIAYHIKKEYKTSNILLDSAISLIYPSSDKLNLAISYYYKGSNILDGENNLQKAKMYFEKVDSIMVISKEYTPDIRNNYIKLIKISKKLNNDRKQLYYLNRLIEIDIILNQNDHVLSKNVTKYYDTPHLLSEKEKIISKINSEKQMYVLTGCFIFIILVVSFYYLFKIKREKKILDKRFHDLINNSENEFKKESSIVDENKLRKLVDNEKSNAKSFDLPIAKELIEKLRKFENEFGYLELNLKLIDLADRFDTNSSYLSKTINQYKGKNFSQYLNDLRIDYAVIKLKKDKKIRKYTVKALAEEFGFNNSESFAKAFHSKTGLQPSYFIKKTNEDVSRD
ncbi:AraC family transcriptional regulator [Flavobacterium sp. ov086]|uniref:helix-turn-helix domain-containing protein n=1 Tax=Flavobacterium sp. ov086 TaxID=1761785 RepID=UPI000B74D84B|nr:helix-turn-helix domain-containing protein [Flavobacterium sp. ov086]SNR95303.1 AraC-type DNA-binding protein [Flavobacterium sp. ov086]